MSDSSARRIGKYEVTGELGHGGMAVVYRARDTQLLRDVAIKVLHPHLANDPESRKRFLREAQAAARLRHPNIVEVFDFSVESDRESFMVSELLEGPTLRRFAEEHPGMPAEVAAAVGVVLCDALACAHAQGVVHRDVKPDNILLQRGGVLKLTDFGIAHVADGGQMTVTGQVLGSPAHMAPEQIEGRSVDPRTDLFAAGTVLYALAVGRLPFEANHPHALLRKILEVDYPDPLRVAPALGHRFAAIVRKCLARELGQRYQSAEELRAALAGFVAEVGWEQPATPLKQYLDAPAGFCTEHRARLLARLPELGARARREGRVPDALGYFNRALALDPGNARVLALVRGIARRRKARRAVGAAAIVVGTALATVAGAVPLARHLRAQRRAATVAIAPEAGRASAHGGPSGPVLAASASAGAVVGERAGRALVADAGATAPRGLAQGTVAAADNLVTAARAGVAPRVGVPGAVARGQGSHRGAHVAAAPLLSASARQAVNIIAWPPGATLYIDSEHTGLNDASRFPHDLTVGPHNFRLVPSDSSCHERLWTGFEVQPQAGEQRIQLRLVCPANNSVRTPLPPSATATAP